MLSQICSGIFLVLALSMYSACFAVVTHVSCIYLKMSPCSLNYPSENRCRHKLGTWWGHVKCVLSGISVITNWEHGLVSSQMFPIFDQWLQIGNIYREHLKCSQFVIGA